MLNNFFISLYSDFFAYYAIFTPIFIITAVCMLISATKTIKLSKKRFKISTIIIGIISLIVLQQTLPYIYQRKALTAKKSSAVINNYKRAISTSPYKAQKAMIQIDLGSYYYKEQKPELALDTFDKVYKYFKTYNIENYGIVVAKIHLRQQNFEKAIEVLKEMDKKDLLSIAYIINEDFDDALTTVNEILTKSENADAYIKRATIYLNMNKQDLAKSDYFKAIALNESNRAKYIEILKNYKNYYKTQYANPFKEE